MVSQIFGNIFVLVSKDSQHEHVFCSLSLCVCVCVCVCERDSVHLMQIKPTPYVELTPRIIALHAEWLAASVLTMFSHSWFHQWTPYKNVLIQCYIMNKSALIDFLKTRWIYSISAEGKKKLKLVKRKKKSYMFFFVVFVNESFLFGEGESRRILRVFSSNI